MSRRHWTYFAVRGGAAVVFVLAATLMPRGVPAALVIMGAGLVGVLACVGTNAGSPGEQAGARPQERWFGQLRHPQGDWPPYEPGTVVEGEVVRPAQATARPPRAS